MPPRLNFTGTALPAFAEFEPGPIGEKKPVNGHVIVKSAFEMSKKTLPTASTLTRACVVPTSARHGLGAVVRRAGREHERVRVAAVDRQRDLHVRRAHRRDVRAGDVPGDGLRRAAGQRTAVFGDVTRNGPALFASSSVVSALLSRRCRHAP